MAEEIVGVKVVVNGGEATAKTVGSIKKELREAQQAVVELSAKFGATSKEAIEAAKRAGELKDAIGDAKALTDAFNPDAKFKAFSASIAGVASGFAAVQGAMGLLGTESEEVQKTLLKVQSAMAISQGLQAVGESIDSFKQLGAVIQQSTVFLKANEVTTKIAAATQRLFGLSVDATSTSFKVLKGAIAATGIGLLVILLGEAVAAFQNYTSAAEDAAKAQEEFNKKTVEYADAQLKGELEILDRKQKGLVSEAKARGANEAEIFEIEQAGRRLRLDALNRYYEQVKGVNDKAETEVIKQIKDTETDITVAQNEERARRRSKQIADNEAAFIEQQEALKKSINAQYQLELDAYNQRKALRDREQAEIIDASKTLTEQRAEQKIKDEEQRKADEEALDRMRESQLGKSIEAQVAANAARLANEKQTSDANIAIATAEAESKRVLLETTASALTNLSIVAGRETVAGKALAIASSIINTYQGATKALAQGGIAGPIAAAGIIAAGLASVKQIVSVKVPGASGGTPSVSAPSLNSGSPLAPTTIAANQVTLDQRSINAIGNKAIRAYVVESEISAAQQKVRRIQRQTTFG
jgi:hypothetical protein